MGQEDEGGEMQRQYQKGRNRSSTQKARKDELAWRSLGNPKELTSFLKLKNQEGEFCHWPKRIYQKKEDILQWEF